MNLCDKTYMYVCMYVEYKKKEKKKINPAIVIEMKYRKLLLNCSKLLQVH